MTEKYENEAHQKPVGKMSPDEINIFLEKGYTLRLSCLKPNGDPFIVPCWHHWEKNNEKSTEEKIEGEKTGKLFADFMLAHRFHVSSSISC